MGVKSPVFLLATFLALGASPAIAAGGAERPAAARPAAASASAAKVAVPDSLLGLTDGPREAVLKAAWTAYSKALKKGAVAREGLLTIIDYTLPSTEPRLWVVDLLQGQVLYRELVAHGRASGDNIAKKFSNKSGSFMSSLGLFVTDQSYMGENGYSMRLRGLDKGVNDHAYDRAIVMHGADYVDEGVAQALGRLGRSLGCPAVRPDIASALIDTIKDGTVMFAYGAKAPAKRQPAVTRVRN
jgi:hypothetical protein